MRGSCEAIDQSMELPVFTSFYTGLRIIRHLCESPVQSHQGSLYTKHNYLIETSSRNTDFLTQCLPQRVLALLIQLVCLRDLHMLVLALDALFGLSTQGPALCDALVGCLACHEDASLTPPLIPTLIGYLTFEAQSFGSEGLIRMRVMQVSRHFFVVIANRFFHD